MPDDIARRKVLSRLPRTWWFPSAPGLDRRRGINNGTYWAYPLDDQPSVSHLADATLSWLEDQPVAAEWGLDDTDATPMTPLTPEAMQALTESWHAPEALTLLARRRHLQRRIRSFTGCYFDLGEKTVRAGDGMLFHFLSDQQWVRHWLVLLDGNGSSPVISSTLPIGFHGTDDDEELPVHAVVPLDGSVDLTVAADSVEEFLVRFWLENEIAFRVADAEPLTEAFAGYVQRLPG